MGALSLANTANVGIKVGGTLIALLPHLVALADGGASLEEVRSAARAIALEVDIKAKVKGQDILTEDVENDLFDLIARIAFNVVAAARSDG